MPRDRDLAQRIVDAMISSPDEVILRDQVPHRPDTETLLGALPQHLRPLAALLEESNGAARAAHQDWQRTPDNSPEDAAAKAVFIAASGETKMISDLFWRSVEEHIRNDEELYSRLRLTSDWQVVGVRWTAEERAMDQMVQSLMNCIMP